MIPFDAINAAALAIFPELVADWFPNGRMKGREWTLGSLNGEPGRSLSINVATGKWGDFSADLRGGDPISLAAAAFHGGDRVSAARALGKKFGFETNGEIHQAAPAPQPPTHKFDDDWTPTDPTAASEPTAILKRWQHVWRYNAADGGTLGFVVRSDTAEGKKILPLNYGIKAGVEGWYHKHLANPRPLYGIDRLAARPDAPVLVVEGEKSADAAGRMFPEYVAVTWQAGVPGVAHTDWTPLHGRELVVWPDADIQGYVAAAEILNRFPQAHCLNVLDDDVGTDAADLMVGDPNDWMSARHTDASHILDTIAACKHASIKLEGQLPTADWIAANLPLHPDAQEEPPLGDEPQWDNDGGYDGDDGQSQASPERTPDREGVIPLGHDRGTYFYYSLTGKQVHGITAANHTKNTFASLASIAHYWQRNQIWLNTKNEVKWDEVTDTLMAQCRSVGIFDPERLRGRGAWLDGDHTVLHVGDEIILDGVRHGLLINGSRHIYEQAARVDMELGDPLFDSEAETFRQLCVAAPWEEPEHMGKLLGGWCVIAPVCGAMPWRPHLWISSEAGGGKSWTLDNIIKPIVGPIALQVQSKTTEAGLRQTLGCDARPIIFDEAETQNDKDRERVQLVLDLARQASSEEGAAIIKGSASGKAMQYRIRSCFVFASINVGMSQAADESRTVLLTLKLDSDKDNRTKEFARLRELHAKVMVPGFAGRLLARTLALLPVIRQNAMIFADAIARSGQSRRTGDTYGVLLAGSWSLCSSAIITPAQADKQVAGVDWVKRAVVKGDTQPEWQRALGTLLQHRTRVINTYGRTEDIPVNELIHIAESNDTEPPMFSLRPSDAEKALSRVGILIGMENNQRVLHISNLSLVCKEVFSKSEWSMSWTNTLLRIQGAHKNATPTRMAGGMTRYFTIPLRDET
jgi:putative DNA primase/helicase